jgi:Sec-independent protein translocase protein TatA
MALAKSSLIIGTKLPFIVRTLLQGMYTFKLYASEKNNKNLYASKKNKKNLNRNMMARFRSFVQKMELKDLYLHGRIFTWSNE